MGFGLTQSRFMVWFNWTKLKLFENGLVRKWACMKMSRSPNMFSLGLEMCVEMCVGFRLGVAWAHWMCFLYLLRLGY
jgi:hypothetical protein